MPMTREEILKKIAEANVSSGGNNLRDGKGQLVLQKFELTTGFNGERAVFEFVVVSSQKKNDVVSVKTGEKLDIEPNAPGSTVSIVNMLGKHDSAFGNTKGIVLALWGEAETSNEELLAVMQMMLDSGAGVGRVINYDTYRKETKENKVEIVLPKWFSVEQTDERVEQMKAWLAQVTAAQAPTGVAATA